MILWGPGSDGLPGSPECSVNFVHAQQNTRGREGRGDGRLTEHGHPAGTQLTIRLPYNLLAMILVFSPALDFNNT